MDLSGAFDPEHNRISINKNAAHHSSAICHELTHAIVYSILESSMIDSNYSDPATQGMDEAFATYYPCAYRANPTFWNSPNYQFELSDSSNIMSVVLSPSLFNESNYSEYGAGRFIASAWWSMRQDPAFNHSTSEMVEVDTLLFSGLSAIKNSENDRAKPRLFFNKLMKLVDNDNICWPLNEKQLAIKRAYNERELFFSPEVISTVKYENAEEADELEINNFVAGDKVSARVFNMPQNTFIQFHIVPHRVEGYSDNLSISNLSLCFKHARSDSTGTAWVTFEDSINLLPGEYDILVDINSDNYICSSYDSTNVVDAIDGRDAPGFYLDWIGDMVVALDLSSTMQGYGDQLARTVKTLEQSMIPSERINVFGFTEGTANQNWLENGITDLIGDENSFIEATQIDSNAINSVMNSVSIEGNTDLVLPFYHGDRRLSNLEAIGNRKNIILLSDGVHFVTPPDPDFPGYQGNWTHTIGFIDTLITTVVVPDSIRCYTICYGDSASGIENMRHFATLGNGAYYHVGQLGI